jgi:hypothetical protein
MEPRSLGTTETEQPQVGPTGDLAGRPNHQHAFDVDFEDGVSFLEPHATIRKANKIAPSASVESVELQNDLRHGFFVHYDNSQTAEVSWAFIRELPPKPRYDCVTGPFARPNPDRHRRLLPSAVLRSLPPFRNLLLVHPVGYVHCE